VFSVREEVSEAIGLLSNQIEFCSFSATLIFSSPVLVQPIFSFVNCIQMQVQTAANRLPRGTENALSIACVIGATLRG